MYELKIIKDPFGKEIVIQQKALALNQQLIDSEEVMDDISAVIEKPIMIFKMKEGPMQLYYLRAIGWNRTLLIGVQENGDHFEIINYQLDPPIDRINELHIKAERLL